MSTYDPRTHTDAVIAAIQALGVTVGDGGGDADGPMHKDLTLPYAVVYALPSGAFEGSMDTKSLDAYASPTVQVTFCGEGRSQAQWLQKKVRDALVGSRLAVDGRHCDPIRLHTELAPGRDTTVTPYIWWAIDQYRYSSTPE